MESVYPYLPAKLGTWQYPYPPLLTLANTWTKPQTFSANATFSGGAGIPGNVGNNPGMHFISFASAGFNPGGNLGWYLTPGAAKPPYSIIFNVESSGGLYAQNKGGSITGFLAVPLISNPTIASATVYQNTTNSYQTIDIPCYATTAGTAGTVAVAYGTSSTPSTIYTQYVSGSTSSTAQSVVHLRVPPQWYYELTATGVTLGTPTMVQE